jgi:hypothetical protein
MTAFMNEKILKKPNLNWFCPLGTKTAVISLITHSCIKVALISNYYSKNSGLAPSLTCPY